MLPKAVVVLAVVALLGSAAHAAILPGQGFLPGGNLRTVDNDGPYNFTLLDVQANEIKVGIAAKQNYTDKDLIDFLVNAECLEGLFDTWGVFGRGFNGDLEKGGPTPIGARAANLTDETRMYLAEVALNEQGHALFTRHAGSNLPCPAIDFTGGWNKWMAAAFELGNRTIEEVYGREFDPFQDDQTFVTCVLILEELGATGNKGLIGLFTSPVLANGVAGLATSANSQATIERMVLWKMRDMIIEPFNETVQQVFARASALRDRLDGVPLVDQGLTNTDPRTIAVPFNFLNLIPTDVRGLTRNRSPQQNINILTLGNPEGRGVFFPDGLVGRLNKPTGYNESAEGLDPIGSDVKMSYQEPEYCVGDIPPPITGPLPVDVPDMLALTQAIDGDREDWTYRTRGYVTVNSSTPYFDDGVQVGVGAPNAESKELFQQEMQNQSTM